MGISSHGAPTRVLTTAAAAAFAIAAAAPVWASDPPAPPAKPAQEKRYCAYLARAGAAPMEKVCMSRGRWIKDYGIDPTRFRK